MSQVLIVGSVALDTIEGPAGAARDVLGGSATYASCAAAFFAPVKLVACVGKDFPERSVKLLEGRGIDLSGLERLDGSTFRWTGRYSAGFRSRETLHLDLGVFGGFRPKLAGALPPGSVLFLANIDPDLQYGVLSQAGDDVFVASDTIDHWIRMKSANMKKMLARTNLFFLNDEEAELLTGENNPVAAGGKIRAMGPRYVVIKKGAHGALLFGPSGIAALPALPLDRVVDPTGAGDVFAGAMLGWLAESASRRDDDSMRAAMARAVVMSSFVVEEFSVERLMRLDHGDIEERLDQLRALVRF
jgi:sugar/nucleoside kinase (ribokinase family)